MEDGGPGHPLDALVGGENPLQRGLALDYALEDRPVRPVDKGLAVFINAARVQREQRSDKIGIASGRRFPVKAHERGIGILQCLIERFHSDCGDAQFFL
jgi:hypothetical protein